MTDGAKTVIFQAKTTNSSPLSAAIDHPLFGAGQDIKLGGGIISGAASLVIPANVIVNAFAFESPMARLFAAASIFFITKFSAWALIALPYFKARRPQSFASVRIIVYTCLFVSAASVACAVYELPSASPLSMLGDITVPVFRPKLRPVEVVRRDVWDADGRCHYAKSMCVSWVAYAIELDYTKRKLAAPEPSFAEDATRIFILALYGVLLVAIMTSRGMLVEALIESERKDAIAPTVQPKPDEEAGTVFKKWLTRCVKISPDPKQTVKVDEAYAKYRTFCVENKSSPLDLTAFKARMKTDGGLEPTGDAYQGVTISDGSI